MNILLVYPQYPNTFWSFKYALKFVSKKAVNPPLGLLTISSMLPENWGKKLIDLNIESLRKKDILWADYVFISAMNIQAKSANEIIEKCRLLDKKIVCGGPLFTEEPEKFGMVDHLILNEAELTLQEFLTDLENGTPKQIYQTDQFADMKTSPIPDYSLVRFSKYNSMNLQFTRGCPFDCEFCDITALLGRKIRTKTTGQILTELDSLYNLGCRGDVFFVDDNFIGKKQVLKKNLLPAMIEWMRAHSNPFTFSTQASINLADDNELIQLMTHAGFSSVFVGIETPQEKSLEECHKVQNLNRDLLESVKIIQNRGMEVQGGFIVGFDNDTPDIFKQQIDFIQNSRIISAMVGLLNAPTKSRLYQRLKNEGRILNKMTGDNTDSTMNFIPKMNKKDLVSGYRKIIMGIYSGKPFYQRVQNFLQNFRPRVKNKTKLTFTKFMAMIKSMLFIGLFDNTRRCYWHLFFWSLFHHPKLFPLAITYSIYGYHYRKVFKI